MRIVRQLNAKCVILRDYFDVRFTPDGKRLAIFYDPDRHPNVRFVIWNENIIDALYDLLYANDDLPVPLRVSLMGGFKEVAKRRTVEGDTILIYEYTVKGWNRDD